MRKLAAVSMALLLCSCASTPTEPVITENDNGSFTIVIMDESEWSGQILTNRLIKQAEEYCNKDRKKFEKIAVDAKDDGRFNYAKSKVIFKCVP